jgi:hypothetical protein
MDSKTYIEFVNKSFKKYKIASSQLQEYNENGIKKIFYVTVERDRFYFFAVKYTRLY